MVPPIMPSLLRSEPLFACRSRGLGPTILGLMERPGTRWPCLSAHQDGVTLRLKVSPNAAKTEAGGLSQNRLRLRVQTPPVEGAANRSMKKWASKVFSIRPRRVLILRGEKSSEKIILMSGTTLAEAACALDRLPRSGHSS